MDAARIDLPSQPADELSLRRVAQLRAETPGCEHRLHLNTAGAGLPPNRVLEAVTDHLLASQVQRRLAAHRINVAANGVPYTPLDMQSRQLSQIARLSVSYLTTEQEIEQAVAAVAALAPA